MRAIEATGKVDDRGYLQLDRPLNNAVDQRVRVIVLLAEHDGDINGREWHEAAAKNPSFAFLQDEEDIYTLNDGRPVSHEG
ncbi:MAG: hypothetical protein DCF25_14665 [Leptolyngbya foveolarum]|uniref:Uncharacterized protein n=1 Tax=Leptolyngbya foveolarum TaxID=47253 RepID=A0A2W4VXY9_9CYAN|nr:MAG: hypothetical protein DCF25_14665 [Leptolyngbya foveolarum]